MDNKIKKNAVCPGSYDPITNGHTDIILRAAAIFPKVYVAVMQNCEKKYVFSAEERLEQCRKVFSSSDNVEVILHSGLLAELCVKLDSVIVKGVRNMSDFDYEYTLSQINNSINRQAETVFLPADREFAFLSSTVVREVGRYGGDITKFVPECISEELSGKLKERLPVKEG